MDWKSRGTAPKDGSHFIAANGQRWGIVYWTGDGFAWQYEELFDEDDDDAERDLKFTHWAARPDKP